MKILFLAEAVSLAHVGRPLMLARYSQDNGVEVHFASSKAGIEKSGAEAFGIKTHDLYTIKEDLFYERVNQCKFFYQTNELKKYVEEELSLISKIKPDLIVSDFRLTAAISSHLMGKPLLNLSNSYWCPNFQCNFPPPEYGIFNIFSSNTTQFLFNFIRPYFFKSFGKELNQTREHFGLKRKKDFRELYTDGTFNAYMDLPNFVRIDKLPHNHFFIGPVIWAPQLNSTYYELKDKNFVYISMGSTGNNFILPLIIKAVLNNKLKVILSGIGINLKEEILKNFPDLIGNSIIEPLIQADKVLPYCQLTVCHGGSGTVYQSTKHGVPVLCFPKNPDQSLVSMAVVKNNIGRYLTGKNSNQISISNMLKECLSNELIRRNTFQMQEQIKSWNTKKQWILFLNKFKTIRKIKKNTA